MKRRRLFSPRNRAEEREPTLTSLIATEAVNDMSPEQLVSATKALQNLVMRSVDPTGKAYLFNESTQEKLQGSAGQTLSIQRNAYDNSRSEVITYTESGIATVVFMGEDLNYPAEDRLTVTRYNLGRLTTQELTHINRPFRPQNHDSFVEGYEFGLYGLFEGQCAVWSLETQCTEPKPASYLLHAATTILQEVMVATEALR